MELSQYFSDEAHCIDLHPSGLQVVVGFTDKLRLMNLLVDTIRAVKEFPIRSCSVCKFSHGGDVFAAVQGNVVQLYSTYTFKNVGSLKGHNGKITTLTWSQDDAKIVSAGADGAIYEWDTRSHTRVHENVLKTCSYTSVALSPDGSTTFAVGSDKSLKEISSDEIKLEVSGDAVLTQVRGDTAGTGYSRYLQVALSASGRLLLSAAANGAVRSYKFPLSDPGEWSSHPAHSGTVTQLCISADDRHLFSAGEDGCLFVHSLSEKVYYCDGAIIHCMCQNDRGGRRDQDIVFAEEILITKSDLDEKNTMMRELSTQYVETLRRSQDLTVLPGLRS